MENLGAIIVGLITSVTTIVVAIIQYNRNKAVLETEMSYMRRDVKCVEAKVDKNITETGKIKDRVIVLEKDVEALKERKRC